MPERPILFGVELRRMRLEADLSLAQLSGMVHYSKGYLSKIEAGLKSPSTDLARLCDAAVSADGALVSLTTEQSPKTQLPPAATDEDEVWLMNLSTEGASWFRPMDRRDALAMSAASLPAFGMSARGHVRHREGADGA